MTSAVAKRERALELAHAFLQDFRRDLERAAATGSDLPPRIRSVQERVGHATPEYRTFSVPVPSGGGGASPEVLSGVISRYAAAKAPVCMVLALDALTETDGGVQHSVLISEVRDREGTRFYLVQPFRVEAGKLRWEEPVEGGWRDPGEEEMILDRSFTS